MPRATDKQKKQMRERAQQRREELIELLGGCCIECGSTENLELDHIDRTIPRRSAVWQCSWDVIRREMSNLQVLCQGCHRTKTAREVAKLAQG